MIQQFLMDGIPNISAPALRYSLVMNYTAIGADTEKKHGQENVLLKWQIFLVSQQLSSGQYTIYNTDMGTFISQILKICSQRNYLVSITT